MKAAQPNGKKTPASELPGAIAWDEYGNGPSARTMRKLGLTGRCTQVFAQMEKADMRRKAELERAS